MSGLESVSRLESGLGFPSVLALVFLLALAFRGVGVSVGVGVGVSVLAFPLVSVLLSA